MATKHLINALASLEVFAQERVLEALQGKIRVMTAELSAVGQLPAVQEIRQCGFIVCFLT